MFSVTPRTYTSRIICSDVKYGTKKHTNSRKIQEFKIVFNTTPNPDVYNKPIFNIVQQKDNICKGLPTICSLVVFKTDHLEIIRLITCS